MNIVKMPAKLISSAVLMLAAAIAGSAATFTVTNTNDSGPGSLRQAILDANATSDADVIQFDAGVFSTPRTITLTSGELLIEDSNLTINGPGTELLSISGNDQSRSFRINAANVTVAVTLNNMTIKDGNAGGGGGIRTDAATGTDRRVVLNISGVVFQDNTTNSGTSGGGIFVGLGLGELNVNNSVFRRNTGNGGGAIQCGSGGSACVAVTITNTLFEENVAGGLGGAGFNCCGNGTPISPIVLENVSFVRNRGGNNGMVMRLSHHLTQFIFRNMTVANNNSGVSGNTAALQLEFGHFLFENSTIAYNTNKDTTGSLPVGINSTWNDTVISFRNTIVAKNTNANGLQRDLSAQNRNLGRLDSLGYNIFATLVGNTVVEGNTTGNQIGANPLLDPISRENGNFLKTLNLRPGSPAIDAGDPANFLATDQRGIARPVDGDGNGTALPDIGAFEKRPVDIVPAKSFDYDGDGRLDFSVFRPSTGAWYLQRTTAGFQGLQFGASGDKVTPADYDGDGKVDIAVFRPSTGLWYILNSGSGTVSFPVFGVSEDIPAPGDYDGDGKADLTVFRPSQGTWYRQNSSNSSFFAMQFGSTGDVPTIGDFDGDGRNDLGIWRPSNGDWYNIRSSDGTVFGERFGQTGDRIAPADYDDDGRTDLAIYRPSTGLWVVRNSLTTTYSYYVFGASSDVPVSGDYDGDGRADIGVWRPTDGTWYVRRSGNGQFIVFPWGQSGDLPTPSAFGN